MSDLAVGQTVQLSDGRRAVIRFVGQTHFSQGDWVGVELDDDGGKNDGAVQGERYFDCAMGRGMFVRPAAVTILQAAPPPKAAAPARRTSRASNIGGPAGGRPTSMTDPALGKRMSLNAPSPSPVPRPGRPSSIGMARSPTKSPTKQLATTAASSTTSSRTGTPSNARVSSAGTRPRPSVGGAAATKTSMGPPALPASRVSRQPSAASNAGRGTGSTRPPSARLSTAGRGVAGSARPGSRVRSGDSLSGNDDSGGDRSGIASPIKSDGEQPTSPVQSRTRALEKLTAKQSATTSAVSPATRATPSTSTRPAANTGLGKENEDLKAKLKVLERKRLEDREKLKELEKSHEQKDKFVNINKKIEGKFQATTQENAMLRKQLKEVEDKFESLEGIQAEHESIMELATLDREMAEETAEVLRVELDALKQKAEELELEVDVLREENAEYDKGTTPEDRATANWIQMERQNERLREALIRLRDISQQADEDQKAQIKDMQSDLEEFDAIKEQYEIAKEKILQLETRGEDLREQLDNALGAEDMIEQLTEEKMNQAEQINELRAAIEDLEALKEINDELEINHVQNAREMQEELDLRDSVIAEQARRSGQQDEVIEDMEYTLSKFRELVTSLQTDLEDMRASHAVNEAESEQLNSKSRAMMDLNLKLQISAAKTQVKTIDLELRRMEAEEAQQHLQIVKLFLPESYEADKNSVLALLRFSRLAFKANLLQGFIKDRIGGQPLPGHEDDVFAGCEAADKLTWVTSMCGRFVSAISHCTLDEFAKYEGALFELEPVERALNAWIDGLRREELKEKQCADELSRTIALMTHLGEVHISDGLESFAESLHMKTVMMQSHLESAATAFHAIKEMVQRVVPSEGEDDELAQFFSKRAEAVISQTRSSKVVIGKALRSLEDLKERHLSLVPEAHDIFEQCEAAAQELADMSRQIGKDLHTIASEEGREKPPTYSEVQDAVCRTVESSFSSAESDLFGAYLAKLRLLSGQINDLAAVCADLSQTQEFESSDQPWKLRAEELKALKTIPVDAEEELRQLKDHYNEARRAIAVRDESLSTANLRIETLESRMKDASGKASRLTDLEQTVLEAQANIAQLKEDREKQDRELKDLELERDNWKRTAGESQVAGADSGGPGATAGHERAVATAREMDVLKSEISSLQEAVRFLREDNRRARVTEQHKYDWLAEPLKKSTPVAEQRKALVVAEGKDVLGELLKMATTAKVFDLKSMPEDRVAWRPAKTTPQYHAAKQAEDFATWKSWQDSVLQKTHLVLHSQSGKRPDLDHERIRRAAARLQIRLPDVEGKAIPGDGRGVHIVGSREWEGLQGRTTAV